MSKPSAKALIVEESGFAAELTRPDPPAELSDEEAVEWRRVVDSMPANHFIPANYHMLIGLCRLLITARQLSGYIKMFCQHKDVSHVRLYKELCERYEVEMGLINRLSRSMRLTQQSTFIKKSVDLKKVAKQSSPAIVAEQLEMETTW